MIDYRLYLVTDDPSRYTGFWLDNVVAAVEGGVTCVQYRDTESPRELQYRRILALRDALVRHGTPIVVNNDPELAAAVKAEGVHVGQNDLPPRAVRRLVGPGCEIGYSITDPGQLAARAEEIAASDALGIGPVFDARGTKRDAAPELGVAGLAAILSRRFPEGDHSAQTVRDGFSTVAIGGITPANAGSVLAAGVGGLAVVSAFSKAEDPYSVAVRFRSLKNG